MSDIKFYGVRLKGDLFVMEVCSYKDINVSVYKYVYSTPEEALKKVDELNSI